MPDYVATVYVKRNGKRFPVIGEVQAATKGQAALFLMAIVPNAVSVRNVTKKED